MSHLPNSLHVITALAHEYSIHLQSLLSILNAVTGAKDSTTGVGKSQQEPFCYHPAESCLYFQSSQGCIHVSSLFFLTVASMTFWLQQENEARSFFVV